MAVPAPALHRQPTPRPALRLVQGEAARPAAPAVYRRRRLLAALAALAAAVALGVGGGAALPVAAFGGGGDPVLDASAVSAVVVGPGETVWTIAAAHLPAGGDLRHYVAEVLALNDVDAGSLRPGQVLRLP